MTPSSPGTPSLRAAPSPLYPRPPATGTSPSPTPSSRRTDHSPGISWPGLRRSSEGGLLSRVLPRLTVSTCGGGGLMQEPALLHEGKRRGVHHGRHPIHPSPEPAGDIRSLHTGAKNLYFSLDGSGDPWSGGNAGRSRRKADR